MNAAAKEKATGAARRELLERRSIIVRRSVTLPRTHQSCKINVDCVSGRSLEKARIPGGCTTSTQASVKILQKGRPHAGMLRARKKTGAGTAARPIAR